MTTRPQAGEHDSNMPDVATKDSPTPEVTDTNPEAWSESSPDLSEEPILGPKRWRDTFERLGRRINRQPPWWVSQILVAVLVGLLVGGVILFSGNHFNDLQARHAEQLENLRFVRERAASGKGPFPFAEFDLQGQNMSGLTLPGADFKRANLSGAALAASTLSGALFAGANLSRADLFGTDLTSAIFVGTDLKGANLQSANLSQASLLHEDLTHTVFSNTGFSQARFVKTNLSGVHLDPGTDFSGASFKNVNFARAFLDGTVLDDANLDYVDFTNADLFHVDLSRANISNVKLDDIYYDTGTRWPSGFQAPPSRARPHHPLPRT
jgi:uncharacterized protein YjbI with pentapeptide repeats